jgi:hypothetical protein
METGNELFIQDALKFRGSVDGITGGSDCLDSDTV